MVEIKRGSWSALGRRALRQTWVRRFYPEILTMMSFARTDLDSDAAVRQRGR